MQVCIIRSQEPVSAAVQVLKRGARRLFKVHHPRSQSDRRVEKRGGEAKCTTEEGEVTRSDRRVALRIQHLAPDVGCADTAKRDIK